MILVRVIVANMSCFSFQTSRLRLERAWVSSLNLGGSLNYKFEDCGAFSAIATPGLFAHLTLTVGTTDMLGSRSTSGRSSNTIFTGTRCTILT